MVPESIGVQGELSSMVNAMALVNHEVNSYTRLLQVSNLKPGDDTY